MASKLWAEWLALATNLPDCGLLDQELAGVDPFDINLPTEMKMRIWTECKLNPRYFFMYVIKAPQDEIKEIDKIAIRVMEDLKS